MTINEDSELPDSLREALDRLNSAEGEMILNFAAMPRIGADGLSALEELATKAAGKGVRVVLDGVSVDVYKVLKLVNLAPRFSFQN